MQSYNITPIEQLGKPDGEDFNSLDYHYKEAMQKIIADIFNPDKSVTSTRNIDLHLTINCDPQKETLSINISHTVKLPKDKSTKAKVYLDEVGNMWKEKRNEPPLFPEEVGEALGKMANAVHEPSSNGKGSPPKKDDKIKVDSRDKDGNLLGSRTGTVAGVN